jgi:hypothetical protein
MHASAEGDIDEESIAKLRRKAAAIYRTDPSAVSFSARTSAESGDIDFEVSVPARRLLIGYFSKGSTAETPRVTIKGTVTPTPRHPGAGEEHSTDETPQAD